MSSGIERIKASKYFPLALFVYLGYFLILLFFLLPSLPEIFDMFSETEIASDELSASPIVPFGIATFLPLVIFYILIDYKALSSRLYSLLVNPFKELDQHVLIYTISFLFLQLAITAATVSVLAVVHPTFLDYTNYTPESSLLVWVVAGVFCLVNTILNVFIGWKWTNSDLTRPTGMHWTIGYITYLSVIGIVVIVVQSINPSVKGILLWPFAGIVIIGTLSYFVVVLGLFLVGLEILLAPMDTSLSDAAVGFVFMSGILFMIASFVLLFIPLLNYSSGVFLAKWKVKRQQKS